jgi:hypothetical protein
MLFRKNNNIRKVKQTDNMSNILNDKGKGHRYESMTTSIT